MKGLGRVESSEVARGAVKFISVQVRASQCMLVHAGAFTPPKRLESDRR